MVALLKERLLKTLRAVAPLIAVGCVLQFAIVGAPLTVFLQFLAGSVLVTLGLLLLFAGIDVGLLPMGRFIGAALSQKKSLALLLGVAFSMGLPPPLRSRTFSSCRTGRGGGTWGVVCAAAGLPDRVLVCL